MPANREKSTITSARSAGPRNRDLSETLSTTMSRRLSLYVTGWLGMSTGVGRNPPSVPIWIHDGPTVAGSGTPPALPSVGQEAGQVRSVEGLGTAGTILTSVLARGAASADDCNGSAVYICRFSMRSLLA